MMKKSALDEVTEHLVQLQNLLYEDKRYEQYRPYLWINCALSIIKDYGKLSEKIGELSKTKMGEIYGKSCYIDTDSAKEATDETNIT